MGKKLTSDEEVLLSLVPANGEGVGNLSLIRQLAQSRWSEDKFWSIRGKLLSDGILIKGRGKGGSVRRTDTSPGDPASPLQEVEPRAGGELALYQPLLETLKSEWIKEMQIEADEIHFEISASLGRKATGGVWTRPDITAVSVRSFPHLPGKYLDIWTFEVKALHSLNILGVYEAAAHASRATRSIALLQVPPQLNADHEAILERCDREAERLRVGLITFSDPANFETWYLRIDAPRMDTAPEALEELIAQLSDVAKKRLSRWK